MPGKSPVDLKLALHGGEDYELIFTAPSKKKLPSTIKGVQITEIGRVTKNRRMLIRSRGKGNELQPQGWEHFS
jgi:thiamine-monophosphate kinase